MSGDFFAIDRNSWAKVCELGMNPAVAYLVLACFSGRTNSCSWASTNAVERYTGISRSRAKTAILSLVANKIISSVGTATKPQYDLLLPEKQELIWLPNAIVTGAADETPPVERLRQTQEVMALRLFVDLYYGQNLVEDGGIRRSVLYKKYDRTLVDNVMEFSIWSFIAQRSWIHWNDLTNPHVAKEPTKNDDGTLNYGKDLFERLHCLENLGLFEWVPTICESDSVDSELIFPCHGTGCDVELSLYKAIYEARTNMLTPTQLVNIGAEAIVVPVPRHIGNAALVGIARLRYRPQTRLTSKWFGELNASLSYWQHKFETIGMGRTNYPQYPQAVGA